MSKFKQYSSSFATKLNYVLDILNITPLQYGRTKAIENITKERESTVNNWLFNGKYPRENKKLYLADTIGVSYNYLFNDSVSITDITKPEIYESEQCYLVPFIHQDDIFKLKINKIFPIASRCPIMFPNFENFINRYGTNIYMSKIMDKFAEPYIQEHSNIIYSENVIIENFKLFVYNNSKDNFFIVKRCIKEKNRVFFEYFNNKKVLTKEPCNLKNIDNYLAILLSLTG